MKTSHKDTLIILEDEPAHAKAIQRALSTNENECTIIIVDSLHEFARVIDNVAPDLIIADINLPDGNAFTLLKGNLESQSWPVIVVTSYGDEETAVKAIKSGAIDYIVKSPEAFRNIKNVVKRNLREWRNINKSKELERKFRFLFETMAQGVLIHDINGKIVAINSAAKKMLRLTEEQIRNISAFDPSLKAVHEDGSDFKLDEYPVVVTLRTGLPVKDTIMGIHFSQDNTYTWLIVNVIPQMDENDKKPSEVFVTISDITELKKAKEKAEESDKLKSAFMANMSHEIRTPMNGILGFADLLKTPNLSGESHKRYLEAIELSGKRMLDIINDLVDISKIEAGQIEIKKESTNIPELLEHLLVFFTPESEKRGISLKFNLQLPYNGRIIKTDKTKLAQIITNLLKNSLKFTNNNGYIELGCKLLDNGSLFFYVKDTGTGIRKELQDRIFERFQQGDISQEHEGVGLGLAISKAYVELLGGKIGIESEPGKGSIFFFTIPFDGQLMQTKTSEENERSIKPLTCVNILVAEDDEISYLLLRETLQKRKINAYWAKNGLEAVNMVKNQSDINLVIMDIKMPIMNGVEATRQIKAIKPGIPVIIQSAFANQAEIQSSYEAGCDDYITKPINMKELLNKLSTYC